MKRRLFYLMLCAVAMLSALTACIDDNIVDPDAPGNGLVKVSLRLVLPSGETARTRAGGTDTQYGELDYNTTYQKYIGDIWILVFSRNESGEMVFDGLVENLKPDNNQGDQTRTVEGTYRKTSDKVEIAVLTNLTYNLPQAPRFNEWKGLTEQEIYEKLVYDYPKEGLVLDENRFLPMWGKSENVSLDKERNEASLSLYRAVAKMRVQVDTECKTFTLEKVYVYYDNNSGYCAAPHVNPNQTVNRQYEAPDVPASATSFDIDNPQVYTVTGNITMEQIYLSEVKNKENKGTRMKVVVGGHYTGEGLVESDALSYYRIDMEDTYDEGHSTNVGTMTPFDIIRNHSYIFNITGVDNPGTPTPDKALDSDVAKVKVRIEQYADEPMRGVPDQYTLTTDESVITFKSFDDLNEQAIEVWTDYELGWDIEDIDGENTDWLVLENTSGNKNQKVSLKIRPGSKNRSLTRTAHFMVTAGNIKKQITVIQPQPPTANCYVVGEGEHEMIVTIKGNGITGTQPEGVNILPDGEDATLAPDKIGIIWETTAGLITLIDSNGNQHKGAEKCDYNHSTKTIKYKVNTDNAKIGGVTGGNALIGAFKGEQIIWSWHIWVCSEVADPSTQTFKVECTEEWPLTKYAVMDRNLGALSNKPLVYGAPNNKMSVASMGLLYQWGRKDPFIGSNYSNEAAFVNQGDGLIPVMHYYKDGWKVSKRNQIWESPIEYTIHHPTILVYNHIEGEDAFTYPGGTKYLSKHEGLSEISGTKGAYLWGTNQGFSETVIDVGSKTIYDPCPEGYRVPPVDAFVFRGETQFPANQPTGDIDTDKLSFNDWDSKDWRGNYIYPWQSQQSLATTLTDVYVQWAENGYGQNRIVEQFYKRFNRNTPSPAASYRYFRYRKLNGQQKNVSSLKNNWNQNVLFVPHHITQITVARDWAATFSQTLRYTVPYQGNVTGKDKAVGNGLYYGFWLNRNEYEEPHVKIDINSPTNGYEILNQNDYTWLPISGVLDPSKGFTMRTFVDKWPTLSVNSFLWTNSSEKLNIGNGNKRSIPAAMFLHGGEGRGNNNGGRHIHAMTYGDIRADSHFAGSVRCVRDRKKLTWSQNDLPKSTSIRHGKGSETTFSIVSVGGGWKLVEPGAPWIKVTPDRGGKTPLAGQPITIRIIGDINPNQATTLAFQIDGEAEPRKITIRTTW